MQRIITVVISMLLIQRAFAQVPSGGGMIVNEINQGTGIKEFMEFLVLGDPANPCLPVDLSGWVVDDNNGSFESCGVGVGIATGHYRLTSCYNAVPPGSLLVIYNSADPYVGMPANDPTDADGDGVYIIPSNSTCLEANYTVPSSSPVTCTYAGAYVTPTATWASGMANSGDVAQVRKPDYSFFHGFSYGDVNSVFPSWPSGADAGTSFNKGSGNLALDCGSCWSSANYITTTAGAGTPGAANTTNNANFINNLLNCTLNYADLSDVDNCTLLLPILSIPFTASVHQQQVELNWSCAGLVPSTYNILHTLEGADFETIASMAAGETVNGQYIDNVVSNGIHYYQLEILDMFGEEYKSDIISVAVSTLTPAPFPNPTKDLIRITNHPAHPYTDVFVISMQGETVITQVISQDDSGIVINVQALPSGHYIICLPYNGGVDYFPLIR